MLGLVLYQEAPGRRGHGHIGQGREGRADDGKQDDSDSLVMLARTKPVRQSSDGGCSVAFSLELRVGGEFGRV